MLVLKSTHKTLEQKYKRLVREFATQNDLLSKSTKQLNAAKLSIEAKRDEIAELQDKINALKVNKGFRKATDKDIGKKVYRQHNFSRPFGTLQTTKKLGRGHRAFVMLPSLKACTPCHLSELYVAN